MTVPILTPTPKLEISASADTEQPALVVESIHKRFGANHALRGMSFSVGIGERLALLGPNGAGKTTLIRTLSGRSRPDSGEVLLFGKSIREPNVLQELGVVPQELAIYLDLTAQQNLECFGQLHGLRGKHLKERVNWALEWIGLADRSSELVKNFSGGMKRRVNIACGILHKPRILLLDEPTVGVDPQSRQRIFDMLDELHALGTSIVLTTHHLDEAESRCDRIVIVDHGQVVADGSLEDLMEQTVGSKRQIFLEIEGVLVVSPPGLRWDAKNNRFVITVDNIAEELPNVLTRIQRSGGTVKDLQVHQPNLHDVFLHLTGKELRE
jgi:ABC-2 type transport system ATP-binding protein